jgi:hypothetical protein
VKLSEEEYFASRAPGIAALAGARRKAAIANLRVDDPSLWDEYQSSLRLAEGQSHFIRNSGRYPLCGRGDVNTYAVFAEVMRDAVSPSGRLGAIIPTGIATEDTTRHFFSDIAGTQQLISLLGFDHRTPYFGKVQMQFCLLTLSGRLRPSSAAEFAHGLMTIDDLADPERRFILSPADLALINPNTKTAPVFCSRRDAEITKAIYRRVPVLVRVDDPEGNPWGINFQRMFDMTNDSHLFRTAIELVEKGATKTGNAWVLNAEKWLPMCEDWQINFFDHRVKSDGGTLHTDADKTDPTVQVEPRYWVAADEVSNRLHGERWLFAFRNRMRATDARSFIGTVIPPLPAGNVVPVLRVDAPIGGVLPAVLSSFVADFVARQKASGMNMNLFIVKQLAVLAPDSITETCRWSRGTVADWLRPRALELTYTAWDLKEFGADLGYLGSPFRWDPDRREIMRAELDAAFFHLYGIVRDDVDYIMDSFPIVKRNDEAAHGEYRTKRLILERYVALAEAAARGTEYQTVLDPPPADPRCAHPASTRPAWA